MNKPLSIIVNKREISKYIMTNPEKLEYIKILKSICRYRWFNIFYGNKGLCYVLKLKSMDKVPDHLYYIGEFHEYFKTWKHFSGNKFYPIPSCDKELSSAGDFMLKGRKWSGKRGKLRVDLCKHIIAELQK